jgi:hypothetical protein
MSAQLISAYSVIGCSRWGLLRTKRKSEVIGDMQYEKEQRILKDLHHGESDLIQLHSCLRFLENSNVRLYNRLLNSSKPTKTLEVLAEVKLYVDLAKKIPGSEIIYELATSFPPDFYFKMDGVNVYLEVKTPSKLKDEKILTRRALGRL